MQNQTMKNCLRAGVGTLLALTLIIAATINLESTPPLWWDEGWTLSVARNWVERGHYGRLLAGESAPPGLAASFPVAASVALSFRLFGVGIRQGRLVGVIYMVGTLAVIYYLAYCLYSQSVALGTLAVLLLMSPHLETHPVYMGREVMAELPMLFYLLAGYAFFLSALRRPRCFMPAAMSSWGIALITKAQVLPFWTASLVVPLSITLFKREWKTAGLLGIGLLGSFVVSQLLVSLLHLLLQGHTLPNTPLHGLYGVIAFVLVPSVRSLALLVTFVVGLPTLPGLCYAAWQQVKDVFREAPIADVKTVRLALLALVGSWFGWFVALSVGWPRLLSPATFVGSIFLAAMLYDLTDHFSLSSTIKRGGYALRHLRFNGQSLGALLAIVLICITVPITLIHLYQFYVILPDKSALQVTKFLNTQTAANALIETYDSEIHFLLDRRYHYPPDQMNVRIIRRANLGQSVPLAYDPLAADPDYLVVGKMSRASEIYDRVLVKGAFHLLREYGAYKIYARVR